MNFSGRIVRDGLHVPIEIEGEPTSVAAKKTDFLFAIEQELIRK